MDFSRIIGIVALLVAVLAVTALASPVQVEEDAPEQTEELELYGRTADGESLVRMKRAACDLLEITGNAACAAHCIWLKNRGGRCKGTVCHCRK